MVPSSSRPQRWQRYNEINFFSTDPSSSMISSFNITPSQRSHRLVDIVSLHAVPASRRLFVVIRKSHEGITMHYIARLFTLAGLLLMTGCTGADGTPTPPATSQPALTPEPPPQQPASAPEKTMLTWHVTALLEDGGSWPSSPSATSIRPRMALHHVREGPLP